ncbi:MAG TPA: hypothetical protein VNN80_36240 [Polyangiaceae bacterium]|nr:hypothetical protein [Polyangiaceae bacterium]
MNRSVSLMGRVAHQSFGALVLGTMVLISADGRAEPAAASPSAASPLAVATPAMEPQPGALPTAALPMAEAAMVGAELAGLDVAAPEVGTATITLAELRQRHNRHLLDGMLGLRSSEGGGELIVGDNTDPWGMSWTKCTNLGIHMMSTLVAEQRGLVEDVDAREDIRRIVDILGRLRTHRGIFPENIQIRGGITAEVVDGRSRFSSIDSAWVTLALSLVQARYKTDDEALAKSAAALIAKQDYRTFVGADGMMGAGYFVDVQTDRKVEDIPFSYKDRNSEARPLVLALVGMNQLPVSAWTKTFYRWGSREGVVLAKGWHFSAFVEMTGALFFDEAKLAPKSLGKSHQNYIEASLRVAKRNGHQLWGYAPACDAQNAYAEFGLDRPDSVSPYAAALLTLTDDERAVQNLSQVLNALPRDGRALPDGLDPRTGAVNCEVARLLDQGLLFLALNGDVVRGLVQKTPWYASAERRLKAMDRYNTPPPVKVQLDAGEPISLLPGTSHGGALALLEPGPAPAGSLGRGYGH